MWDQAMIPKDIPRRDSSCQFVLEVLPVATQKQMHPVNQLHAWRLLKKQQNEELLIILHQEHEKEIKKIDIQLKD